MATDGNEVIRQHNAPVYNIEIRKNCTWFLFLNKEFNSKRGETDTETKDSGKKYTHDEVFNDLKKSLEQKTDKK